MKNPIPYSGMFATPENGEDLMNYIEGMNGSEKALAYMIAFMTMNLAHKMVEEEMQESV